MRLRATSEPTGRGEDHPIAGDVRCPAGSHHVDMSTDDATPLGPISYLIVEFPGSKMTGEGFLELVKLVDAGVIRVLDLVFFTHELDGSVKALALADIDRDGEFDLAIFEGASSGMVDESDLADAAAAITPGSSAGVLIFENRWATSFVQALRHGEAQLVAAGYIPQPTVVASLDATEK